MPDQNKTELLRRVAFFNGIEQKYLSELAGLHRELSFPARTTIFEEYDRAKDVYFILEGHITLAICDASGCRQISQLGKGDLLGWSPLVGRTRLFDTARTATPVKVLAFDAEELLQFCKRNSDFGFEFMLRAAAVLGERLIGTRRQLLEASGVHLPEFVMDSD